MEETLMCRVCLATDVRLYNMHSYDLVRAYENITGFKMTKLRNLPVHMCTFCTAVLLKCVSFKERCGRAVDVLNSMLISSGLVPHSDITNIRRLNKLELPYTSQVEVLLIKEEDEDTDRLEYDVDDADDKSRMFDDEDINVNCGGDDGVAAYADVCDDSTSIIDIKDIDIIENEPEMIKIEKESSPTKENIGKELEFEHVDIELITLSKEEQIQEVQARKFSVNYQNSMYKCDKCFKGFITDATYKNHMYRHDPASGAHSCEACHTRWASARALRSHVVAAHARKFVCRLCAHVTRSANSAREHAHWHNGHTFRCNVCGSTFAKSTSYLTHLRLQHPSKHRCELCGESFLGVNGLKIHKKKSHRNSQSEEFACDMCQAVFHTQEALSVHESLRQENLGCGSGLKPCAQCGHSYLDEERLQEHMTIHHRKNALKCLHCSRTFLHRRSVWAHQQRVHAGGPRAAPAARPNKTYVVCEICGLKCISKASLVHHQRIHSGEKPFQCPECPKKFSVCQSLQIHLRTHTGERPFKCRNCPKAFKHKAALNRHDRVHTGAKPYTCLHCGKSFSQSNSMKLHVRTVHLKMPAPYRDRRKIKDNVPNTD